ncbi:MAG TPA: NADH-quinone oxidoreductase subunit L [Candidatus Nanopelagicaceae bacterium]|nr:NADH-quinone oxidoreductase subunit L [Candidatus Nanopelagicaceae bacterium]
MDSAHALAAGSSSLLVWLIALPALGAAILLLGGHRTDKWGHLLATALSGGSFVVGVVELVKMLGRSGDQRGVSQTLFTWISVGNFHVEAGLLLDQLSICFVLLITGVGTLIHIYSISYMEHDVDRRRFFAYLNFFIAAMLLLVLGNSYLNLYVGWEGVGLASYLLIGFWNQKPAYATAAKKAFIANRVGDFGLSIAIMIAFTSFGSVSFDGVAAGAGKIHNGALTAMGAMLLLAAAGKSAQFPLQSWLGDAMAGPTPVSALIHAATMVTAGVYLIVRSNFVFDHAPTARLLVIIVGVITLLFGAIIGTAKDDIKKALAASTMSQIGYMILAAGLGPAGYAFAIMHLLTHGFFKAGMFLGAGSVMHGMNDEVDMRKYGGLRKFMPATFVTFGLGYLAIIGVPPFAGFYSKDKIIEASFNAGGARGLVIGSAALIGAAITAFYMTRVMIMTFFGKARWSQGTHPHESGKLMVIPMAILAIGSVGAGALLAVGSSLRNWLEPVVSPGFVEPPSRLAPMLISALAIISVLVGAGMAYLQYVRTPIPEVAPTNVSVFTRAARRDLYQDAFNEAVLMRPGQYLTRALVFLDRVFVDGAVNGLGALLGGASVRIRRLQTGFARTYAMFILGGAAIVVAAMLAARL